METQKIEYLKSAQGRLAFRKTNGKQPGRKDFDFNGNGIMTLLKELLTENNDAMVLFQKVKEWRKNGIVRFSITSGGNTIKGKMSLES